MPSGNFLKNSLHNFHDSASAVRSDWSSERENQVILLLFQRIFYSAVDIVQQRGRRTEKFQGLLHQVFGGHKFIRSVVADSVPFQSKVVGIGAIGRKTCRSLFQAAFKIHFKTGITASYQTTELPFSHSDILTQHP